MSVRAVRGATTVKNNYASDILDETKILLSKIVRENEIESRDIISIFFSTTKDLNAVFPAAAARQMGWTSIALMCTNEIDVPESLEKCIRVLIHFNTGKENKDIKHVYLKEAKVLRPDF